jgi:ornithine cyclodeaminase/alanine dehydrogenase-like protein (mu-crystallin family)
VEYAINPTTEKTAGGALTMQIRILTAADIRSALSMTAAIDAVAGAYAQLSAGKATMPLRSRFHTTRG